MPVFKQSYNLTTVATYSSLVWTPSPTLVRRIPDPDGVDPETGFDPQEKPDPDLSLEQPPGSRTDLEIHLMKRVNINVM